jgi:hypothetical protein
LSRRGNDIGAHTLDHANLAQLPEFQDKRQISDVKPAPENLVGMPVTAFYPARGTDTSPMVAEGRL